MRTNSYSAAMFMSWVLSQGIITCPFPNVHPTSAREFCNCYSMLKSFPLIAASLKFMTCRSKYWRAAVENWAAWSELLITGQQKKLSLEMVRTYAALDKPSTYGCHISPTGGNKRRRGRPAGTPFHTAPKPQEAQL